MNKKKRKTQSYRRKRRAENRVNRRQRRTESQAPELAGGNIHYEVSDRVDGLDVGGIGVIHSMVNQIGLVDQIATDVEVLQCPMEYSDVDHVLNITYNAMLAGTCLDDIERHRQDEQFLDALGAKTIPDPTTSGDFCRRFDAAQIDSLMEAVNVTRLNVWARQDPSFFKEAVIDGDGTLVSTEGECKQGAEFAYDGTWGYHPLVISLANTQEPLYVVNRSGNRPSHESAGEYFDRAIALCQQAGFQSILLRGDTDFTQTVKLDGWDDRGVRFIFGAPAHTALKAIANSIPDSAWSDLERPPKYTIHTKPRSRPENVKQQVVLGRGFKNIRLRSEQIYETRYQPYRCDRSYRLVIVRKNLSIEKGEQRLFDEVRFFFYLTNDWSRSAEQIVRLANERCNQENLIGQLRTGVAALQAPVDSLLSNWAYMVMASLGWTLKIWSGLLLPIHSRWRSKHESERSAILRMEFKRFFHSFVRVPCQIVRTGRRIVYRIIGWNPWQATLLRIADALREPRYG